MQYRVLRGHFSESLDGYHCFRVGQIVTAREDQSSAAADELVVVGTLIRGTELIAQNLLIEDLEAVSPDTEQSA